MEIKYYQTSDGFFHLEVRSETKNIIMHLDPLEGEHSPIISAIGEDENKASKYANYLVNGGCEYFNLDEILNAINK